MKVQVVVLNDDGSPLHDDDAMTNDAYFIFGGLLEEWANEFLQHNAEYHGQRRMFGKIGELIEMTRKLNKLKAAWWDKVDVSHWRESPDTILKELISHAFLAFVSIRKPEANGGSH